MTARPVLEAFGRLCVQPPQAAYKGIAATLSRSERWPPAEMLRHQLIAAEAVVEHARRQVPFYAGLPGGWAPGELTAERFRELPILTRDDLRDRAEELVSRDPPAPHRVAREANSSGSTGKHVTVRIDSVAAGVIRAISLRDHAWHERDPTLKAAGIRAIVEGAVAPAGRRDARWNTRPNAGPMLLLDVHTPVRDQLDWLEREAPAYLVTYASNAAALVARAETEGIRLPSLREIGTFGEVLPAGLREAARRVFGVPVVDAYSTVELGFIALQCPASERYHAQSESVLVEVLKDDGSTCGPGETGRVVVTALHAYVMPMIRYDVGDYATLGAPCACGRTLPVLEHVVGRVRNMVRLRNGDQIWPRFGSNVLGKLFPVKQFRLIQDRIDHLTLELVVERPLDAVSEARLREFVLGVVAHPFELELRYVDSIPRSPGGKFEDVLCLLDAPAAPSITTRSAG